MALQCLKACKGKITTGRRGPQRYWEGDEYTCPKCGAQYVIGVTDDYEDDAIAYLISKEEAQKKAEVKKEKTMNRMEMHAHQMDALRDYLAGETSCLWVEEVAYLARKLKEIGEDALAARLLATANGGLIEIEVDMELAREVSGKLIAAPNLEP